MCNNGFFGGNCSWIIILIIILLLSGYGGNCGNGYSNNCGCNDGCGC